MKRFFVAFVITLYSMISAASAQESVFIQIEAQPSLRQAEDSVRGYAARLNDVNGFSLGSGWYGIALGPYSPPDAERLLLQLRAQGQIPRDSYLALGSAYQRQFFPVGANALNRAVQAAPATGTESTEAAVREPEPADETPRQARASEARLTAQERKDLQIALQWAGFYNAGIDGAFGRGTRASMADWQDAAGYEATGILTTAQRAELLAQYNAVLDGLGMQTVTDTRAGIAITLPMAVLKKPEYEYPFAHYRAATDLGAQVILISQAGDQATLFGLYDIMQTLEVVPLEGPRERGNRSFSLVGADDRIVSHTEASLQEGAIKGFTLIWPAGDEDRRRRVLDEMRKSLTRLPGVIDPGAGSNAPQDIDLLAGLEIRKPRLSRSGFFVSDSGTVVTTDEVTQSCTRITLDQEHPAVVMARDAETGIAVLRPQDPLAPLAVAAFQSSIPRLKSEVAVSGYSFEGVLNAPTLTFGTLADLQGLRGESGMKRLALAHLPGDAGGPVLDAGGNVLGMLLPRRDNDRQLPDDVSFAVGAERIRGLLSNAGMNAQAQANGPSIHPVELTRIATGMTVLVSCWD